MKLDGDIELPPDYLRTVIERFAADPRLGLAGGVLDEPTPDGGMRRIAIPRHHVHGALKCYSRECFDAIGGVQERLGWDTIDETYARMRGFETRSFRIWCRSTTGRWGAPTARCAATPVTASAPTSRTTPLAWVALRSLKIAGAAAPGPLGSGVLLRLPPGRCPPASSGCPIDEFRRFTHRELRRRMCWRASPGP